jgi:transposase
VPFLISCQCCFIKLKRFHRFAACFDKLARQYLAFVYIAASTRWTR